MSYMSVRGRVFVGMSGGVDSSVSALLLKKQEYDVVGVFIKVWQADFLPCTWREERRDAMRVAAQLEIPLLTLDLEDAYKKEVVDYMIHEYAEGRVPNPDVMCNKHVKFGAFYDYAIAHGADFIATGHYAQTQNIAGHTQLAAPVDQVKDQTYFLWTLQEDVIAKTIFPVGNIEKKQVREIAAQYKLPNAEKKDSQGLCFMGKVDMREFLKHYLKTEEGNVLDQENNIIGRHEGAMLYTIGQRHGFTTQNSSDRSMPLYVINKDISKNTITVGEKSDQSKTETSTFLVGELHQTVPGNIPDGEVNCDTRIRHRGERIPSRIVKSQDKALVNFIHQTEDVTPGQSAVFYNNNIVLGGAIIDKAISLRQAEEKEL